MKAFFTILILYSLSICSSCQLYLVPSKLPGAGRGIVAGRNFTLNEYIEPTSTLHILLDHTSITCLGDYVFQSELDNYAMMMFGAGVMYNFIPNQANVIHYWEEYTANVTYEQYLPYSNTTRTYFETTAEILEGHELWLDYGDSWLEERDYTKQSRFTTLPQENSIYTLNELAMKGVCLTDVYVDLSKINGAHYGLFAAKKFLAGELITVSPVLPVPMSIVSESIDASVWMNYVLTAVNASIGLHPLGYIGMINHGPSYHDTYPHIANIQLQWFDWQVYAGKDCGIDSIHSILSSTSQHEVLSCRFTLDIAAYAIRDIEVDEELLMDYGIEWVEAWNYWVQALKDYEANTATQSSSDNDDNANQEAKKEDEGWKIRPSFRHPIMLPPGFLPENWLETSSNHVDSSSSNSVDFDSYYDDHYDEYDIHNPRVEL
jgi:hypothetical protein